MQSRSRSRTKSPNTTKEDSESSAYSRSESGSSSSSSSEESSGDESPEIFIKKQKKTTPIEKCHLSRAKRDERIINKAVEKLQVIMNQQRNPEVNLPGPAMPNQGMNSPKHINQTNFNEVMMQSPSEMTVYRNVIQPETQTDGNNINRFNSSSDDVQDTSDEQIKTDGQALIWEAGDNQFSNVFTDKAYEGRGETPHPYPEERGEPQPSTSRQPRPPEMMAQQKIDRMIREADNARARIMEVPGRPNNVNNENNLHVTPNNMLVPYVCNPVTTGNDGQLEQYNIDVANGFVRLSHGG